MRSGTRNPLTIRIIMLGGTPKLQPNSGSPPAEVREMLAGDIREERSDVQNYTRLAALAEKEGQFAIKLKMEEQAAAEDDHRQQMERLLG